MSQRQDMSVNRLAIPGAIPEARTHKSEGGSLATTCTNARSPHSSRWLDQIRPGFAFTRLPQLPE